MDGACSRYGSDEKCIQNFWKFRGYMGDLGGDGRIILKESERNGFDLYCPSSG
jgi:hypothetical protein